MENYIKQILNKTFLQHYGLQEALISENALVATSALKILLNLTGLRESFVIKNLQEISKLDVEDTRLELNKTDGKSSEGIY